jgi:hypothetical protein
VHAPTEDKADVIKDSFYEEIQQVFDQFPRNHMKILIGDFNAKVGRENIFGPVTGNESLHEASNDNGVRVENFATSKNLVVKSTTFPHRHIHKHTWTSDGVTHNQRDHVLIDKRRHSNILDVRSFRGADCDTEHYLVVANLRKSISVSKRARQTFDLEIFDLRKLDDLEVKEKYQIEVSNRFAALDCLDECFDINYTWENIGENIKISVKDNLGYHRLKLNKPWFYDECLKLLYQWKQVKLQWLQNPSQINGGNVKNLRHETIRIFRKKKRECLRGKINEPETNNKVKNIKEMYRGRNKFKKWYQPRINIKDAENVNLLAYPQSVLNRWKNFFNQVLNVYGSHDIRQMDIHTAEPLIPEPSLFEVEIPTGNLKSYKSPGTDQIRVELIKDGGGKYYILRYTNLFICVWISS